jgi:S1-C subfamily serine protease
MFLELQSTLQQRPALRAALLVSIGVLLLAGAARYTERHFDLQRERANNRVLRAEQAWLTARLNRLSAADESNKADLIAQLDRLADRQIAADERSGQPPFEVESLLPSIVEIFCLDNDSDGVYYTASGTVIDSMGLVLTNRHALQSGDGSFIRFCGIGFTEDQRQPPRPEYVAAVMAVHKADDLAVLRVTERVDGQPLDRNFQALPLTEQVSAAEALKLGDTIYIGGYPGLGAETFTFTQGVVSGRVGDGLIKTSALIDAGTSGGAAFDAQGQFIGVPTAAVQGEIGGTLGYLIAADVVDRFLADFFANQDVIRVLDEINE